MRGKTGDPFERGSIFRRGSDKCRNIFDTRTQSQNSVPSFLDPEAACWFSHLEEEQIPITMWRDSTRCGNQLANNMSAMKNDPAKTERDRGQIMKEVALSPAPVAGPADLKGAR